MTRIPDDEPDEPIGGWGQPGWRQRLPHIRGGGRNYVPTGRPPGRPSLPPGERMVHQMLSLRPAQIEWLRAQPQGISAAVRNAVSKAMQDAHKAASAVPPSTGDFE